MMRKLLAMAVLSVASMIGQANAGVEGGHFEGTLYYADGETSNFVSADFYDNGTFVETNDQGIEVAYPGTYEETDYAFFSIWTGEYIGYENFEVRGLSIFSVVSLYYINETDGDNDYGGIVWREGDAETLVE